MLTACPGPGGRDSWQPPPPGRKERPACPGLCVPLPAQDAADRLRCPRQHPFLVPLHSTATGRTVPRPQASRSPHSSSHTWGRTRPPGPLGAALVHSCSPRAAAACPCPARHRLSPPTLRRPGHGPPCPSRRHPTAWPPASLGRAPAPGFRGNPCPTHSAAPSSTRPRILASLSRPPPCRCAALSAAASPAGVSPGRPCGCHGAAPQTWSNPSLTPDLPPGVPTWVCRRRVQRS